MNYLRLIMAGAVAFLGMGFFSSAALSEMQQINDNYLSHINGQTAIYSLSNKNSNDAVSFLNHMERSYGVHISDDVKASETITEAFDFFKELAEALGENNHPFAPRLSLLKEGDSQGLDIQMGGMKLRLQSIDIKGKVSIYKN
jgi:hypothetical protein